MSNNRLCNILIALALPVVFYFVISGFKSPVEKNNNPVITSNPVPGPSAQKDFINYILNEDYFFYTGIAPDQYMEYHLDEYGDELNFNGVHIYDADSGTSALGWFNLLIDPNTQLPKVHSLIDDAHTYNLKAVYERSNISNLCYAQRLVYEVSNGGSTTVNDGFCWQDIDADYSTETDGTTYIRACTGTSGCASQTATPTGYIAQDIYENFQHTDLPGFRPQKRDFWQWHMKPRMKIKQSDFSNTSTTPVVTIEAYAFNGDLVASRVIKVKNFQNSLGAYDGLYTEQYIFGPGESDLWIDGDDVDGLNEGRNNEAGAWGDPNSPYYCAVDFKIYWHGNVDVWFDKLTVDDFRANKLFDPIDNYEDFIDAELNNFGDDIDIFFVDELVHSNIPCAKYLVERVRSSHPDVRISMANTGYLQNLSMKDPSRGFQPFLSAVQPDYFQVDAHELSGWRDTDNGDDYHYNYYPDNITPTDAFVPSQYTPDGWKASNSVYTSWLQNDVFGDKSTNNNEIGSFIYQLRLARDQVNDHSPGTQFIMQPQIQGIGQDYDSDDIYDGGLREPLNEEYSAQAMISIAHGADGLCWFWFQSNDWLGLAAPPPMKTYRPEILSAAPQPHSYSWGMINPQSQSYSHRTQNMWGQDKWADIGNTNATILSWKPILDNSTWAGGYSIHSESSTAFSDYIDDIKSIKRNPSSPYTYSSQIEDASNARYWELGFYDPMLDGDFTKYFIMVNRRCTPDVSNAGDFRQLKIKFDGSQLMSFQNWSVTDVTTGQTVVFARNSTAYHDFGEFKPGEGKLYRIAPTVVKGGVLVTNEDISGKTFTCLDTVLNGGYNITIDSGSTVSFTDSASIIMTGGTFQSGVLGSSSGQLTTFKGAGSSKWGGMRFTNSQVKIYNSKFQDISSPSVNYAVSMYNCPLGDIRGSQFVMSTDTSGAVRSVYAYDPFSSTIYQGMYFNFNSVTMNSSRAPAVTSQGFSGLTMPISVMNNTMSSSGYATGVMLTGITSAGVKKNSITGFSTGVNLLGSTADIFSNTISNTTSVSKGVTIYGSGTGNMAPAGSSYTGGYNVITNTYGSSINIELDNSIVLLEDGNNTFDINSSASPQAYHIFGSFPVSAYPTQYAGNCYKLSGDAITSGDPYFSLTDGTDPLSTKFGDYICDAELPEGEDIADLGNGVYDTIPGSEGYGGGMSSMSNVKGKMSNEKAYTLSPVKLLDSVNVQMSRRDYSSAKTFCYELIETYPDSFQSVSSLQTLYLCVTATDTTYSGRSGLKTFYETLILEHGSNTSLVNVCNYLAQKCKVLLGQYNSAMTGFQQIVTNNPYSYEGLLARWDYMATSLLAPGGGGEPYRNYELGITNSEANYVESVPRTDIEEAIYWDDKSPFSKEQKKQIYTSVKTAFETAKNDDDRKIKTLEDNSKKGDVNSTKQLQQMQTLKQIVKTEKPKTIIEHISIVGSDMQKVFGNTSPVAEGKGNSIPTEFNLGQNYPNPFNPVTTIKYALPHDAKVVIKIYDILGREVKMLINQQQTAGYYDVKFDGSVFASGVYFYRIEVRQAGSPTDDYVQSKKMVLVK